MFIKIKNKIKTWRSFVIIWMLQHTAYLTEIKLNIVFPHLHIRNWFDCCSELCLRSQIGAFSTKFRIKSVTIIIIIIILLSNFCQPKWQFYSILWFCTKFSRQFSVHLDCTTPGNVSKYIPCCKETDRGLSFFYEAWQTPQASAFIALLSIGWWPREYVI